MAKTIEKKLKHLDFLQLVITRMNVNSFLVKGWAVTLVAAMFAFAAKDANSRYVFITIATTLIFWLLDAYYLSLERQYRELYNVIRLKEDEEIDFDLNASNYNVGRSTWFNSFFTFTLCLFYFTLLSLTGIIILIVR